MEKYPKIQTVFKRDMANKGRIIEGKYSLPEFEYLKNNRWIFTEKIDGTNIRIDWQRGIGRSIGGRTDNAQIPAILLNCLEGLFSLEKMDKVINPDASSLCLYGEGYGAGIQKGGGNYNPDGAGFVLFDVLVGGWWLKREDVMKVAINLEIPAVPIMGRGTLQNGVDMVKSGIVSNWGEFAAEGLVMRPEVELKTRAGKRIITKIKGRDFNG